LFLCRSCVLESGGCRNLRIHDQSTDRALLHAGLEYDGSARARGTLRCLRLTRTWTNAVLSASDEAGPEVEGTTDLVAFWAINIGLMLEIVLSLLPVGLMQTYQSVSV